jgi:phage protein D
MAQVPKVKLKVTYNGVDITEDITRYLLSATYVDNDEGESDNIEITVEDVDGLWKNGWYPTKGAKLGFSIGYESDDLLVDHGEFEIDEILLTVRLTQ